MPAESATLVPTNNSVEPASAHQTAVILFLFYAAYIWYLCFRFRRRWEGLAVLAASVGALWVMAELYRFILRWARASRNSIVDYKSEGRLFLMLLAVEAVIVIAVGLFFFCLPRHAAATKPCRRCRYELAGLDSENPTCPECGLPAAAHRIETALCSVCSQNVIDASGHSTCPGCAASAVVNLSTSAPARPAIVPLSANPD